MSSGLLIANRGEIAVRIARSAAEAGWRTVAVHSIDDRDALHVRRCDDAVALGGSGPSAYLDVDRIVSAAADTGCELLHPGYGFLSERAELVEACEAAGIAFVGPSAATLARFGDKLAARALARELDVPLLPGTSQATTAEEAAELFGGLGDGAALMVKAVAGGGGRGMRVVRSTDELAAAMERCASEARTAFGDGSLYVEQHLPVARHVEVQLIGDGSGQVAVLGDRECSLQRRHQKIVEIAPAPNLTADVRARLADAAGAIGAAVRLRSLATVEFLVAPDDTIAFLEVNPRLQVEHTVTEQVTGLDLVGLQLRLAHGATLGDLGLDERIEAPNGTAVQVRIATEALQPDGAVHPTGGTVTALEIPSGPGVRVDSALHVGFHPHPAFDSMVAKLIAHVPGGDLSAAARRADRALVELRLDGLDTNVGLLRALLQDPVVLAGDATTTHVERDAERLAARALELAPIPDDTIGHGGVGARVDAVDPLAVLDHGRSGAAAATQVTAPPIDDGSVVVPAPLQGTIVSVAVEPGSTVMAGSELAVMEAMKMEHVIGAPRAGTVLRVAARPGDTLAAGDAVILLERSGAEGDDVVVEADVDLDLVRPDLAEIAERHERGLDAARPAAVERRRRTGQRTARENVADLCDDGTFVEYGPLVLAAQRRRRSVEELIEKTPADGLVGGVGSVNGDLFDGPASQAVVMSYDYTVLAGTQGNQNHRKKDRLFEIAARQRLPVVLLSEGGGGRPGDTDGLGVAGLDCLAFRLFGELSGLVPLVGINSGRCFAGNAALLGCCDVVIATANSNIGMGGPAMIEGGGLGVFRPEEVGPMEVQVPNGVVDIAVDDEAEAVAVAKRYLSYFQGPLTDWECADQRRLRHAIPENRLRAYDIRQVVTGLADTGSVLELRPSFGVGMVTALARIEGRPVGIVANDPTHLGGAIDSPGADKAARFMQLCDAFDLPLVFLCDTPGIMVGPDAETSGTVRHACRLFVVGGSLTVPFVTVVLRKGYGLGAQAMAGGSFHAPLFTVAWPTGEFGGMGLEGAVKLGYRDELAAVEDTEERRELFEQMVARMYDHGKALNFATHFEIDDVIDPADTRRWITSALVSAPTPPVRDGKKRPCIDTW